MNNRHNLKSNKSYDDDDDNDELYAFDESSPKDSEGEFSDWDDEESGGINATTKKSEYKPSERSSYQSMTSPNRNTNAKVQSHMSILDDLLSDTDSPISRNSPKYSKTAQNPKGIISSNSSLNRSRLGERRVSFQDDKPKPTKRFSDESPIDLDSPPEWPSEPPQEQFPRRNPTPMKPAEKSKSPDDDNSSYDSDSFEVSIPDNGASKPTISLYARPTNTTEAAPQTTKLSAQSTKDDELDIGSDNDEANAGEYIPTMGNRRSHVAPRPVNTEQPKSNFSSTTPTKRRSQYVSNLVPKVVFSDSSDDEQSVSLQGNSRMTPKNGTRSETTPTSPGISRRPLQRDGDSPVSPGFISKYSPAHRFVRRDDSQRTDSPKSPVYPHEPSSFARQPLRRDGSPSSPSQPRTSDLTESTLVRRLSRDESPKSPFQAAATEVFGRRSLRREESPVSPAGLALGVPPPIITIQTAEPTITRRPLRKDHSPLSPAQTRSTESFITPIDTSMSRVSFARPESTRNESSLAHAHAVAARAWEAEMTTLRVTHEAEVMQLKQEISQLREDYKNKLQEERKQLLKNYEERLESLLSENESIGKAKMELEVNLAEAKAAKQQLLSELELAKNRAAFEKARMEENHAQEIQRMNRIDETSKSITDTSNLLNNSFTKLLQMEVKFDDRFEVSESARIMHLETREKLIEEMELSSRKRMEEVQEEIAKLEAMHAAFDISMRENRAQIAADRSRLGDEHSRLETLQLTMKTETEYLRNSLNDERMRLRSERKAWESEKREFEAEYRRKLTQIETERDRFLVEKQVFENERRIVNREDEASAIRLRREEQRLQEIQADQAQVRKMLEEKTVDLRYTSDNISKSMADLRQKEMLIKAEEAKLNQSMRDLAEAKSMYARAMQIERETDELRGRLESQQQAIDSDRNALIREQRYYSAVRLRVVEDRNEVYKAKSRVSELQNVALAANAKLAVSRALANDYDIESFAAPLFLDELK